MKYLQLERITEGKSLHWMIQPRLNDFYFWHFHPEVELVLVLAKKGKTIIAEKEIKFSRGILCLIGSGIPHLNFDFGIKEDYDHFVLHIKPALLDIVNVDVDEYSELRNILKDANFGLTFHKDVFDDAKSFFLNTPQLSDFDQIMNTLQFLNRLAISTTRSKVMSTTYENLRNERSDRRILLILNWIEQNLQNSISLKDVCTYANMSKSNFVKFFKKMTKLSFIEFVNQSRINNAKVLLRNGVSVTEACYQSGFDSISYFSRTFKKVTGTLPSKYISFK
jgi:AraC-like DNA-binding protein